MKKNKLFKKKPFFIAEISANHGGKIKNAFKLIDMAKKYKADAVKFQTYTPETMTLKSNKKFFKIQDGIWKGQYLWDLYLKAHTPFEWQEELFKYSKKKGILCFSSVFDETAVDLLEKIKCPIYKISSFEMSDFPLIKYVSRTKKPVIISTGLSDINQIEKTYKFAKACGINDLTLLYCVSSYPAKPDDFNLLNLKEFFKRFNCRIGFSDHSTNNIVATTAVSLGADIIEKHISLLGDTKSPDVKFSLKGREIKQYREDINLAYLIKGKDEFIRKKNELKNIKFKRSIFCVKDIVKGEKFTKKNIKRIRPGYGLDASEYDNLLGQKSKKKILSGDPIKKNCF